jgi:hypothetical protein
MWVFPLTSWRGPHTHDITVKPLVDDRNRRVARFAMVLATPIPSPRRESVQHLSSYCKLAVIFRALYLVPQGLHLLDVWLKTFYRDLRINTDLIRVICEDLWLKRKPK